MTSEPVHVLNFMPGCGSCAGDGEVAPVEIVLGAQFLRFLQLPVGSSRRDNLRPASLAICTPATPSAPPAAMTSTLSPARRAARSI